MGFNPAFELLIIFLIYIFKYCYVQLEESLYSHLHKCVLRICSFVQPLFVNLGVGLKKDTFKDELPKIM